MTGNILPIVLGYSIPPGKTDALRGLCAREGAAYFPVSPLHYRLPLAALPATPSQAQPAASGMPPAFPEEMLLFKGFSDAALIHFLQAYREAGLQKIELKATLTPHNASWDSMQLREELIQERDALR